MKKVRPVFLVRADILGHSEHISASAIMMQGEPVRRRINRLERATESYQGKVISRAPQGLVAAFETAEAAVLGACEMQRRCAVIPQMSGTRVGVQIGIHAGTAEHVSNGNTDAIEATAARLAGMLGDGSVVVSGAVLKALSPPLRQKLYPVPDAAAGTSAYAINWQGNAIASVASVSIDPSRTETTRPAKPSIILHHGGRLFQFGDEHPVISIGRNPQSDIVINDPKASRSHCRIINQRGRCVLVDQSTNGTVITPSEGNVIVIKRELAGLRGNGWITLGHQFRRDESHAVKFEVICGAL